MTPVQALVQELADTCIEDDCGYEPLPQHVASFLFAVRNIPQYQEYLAGWLQDKSLWTWLAPEAMRTDDDSSDIMAFVIRKAAREWAAVEVSLLVDARIDAVMGGWISDEESLVDEMGGAL